MKSMIKNRLLLVTAICFLFAGTSCQYDEIVDIPYPESLVYLPIAVNGSISPDGIYTIEEGASDGVGFSYAGTTDEIYSEERR